MTEKKRINLVEIDAETDTFKIYGMQQPHSPIRLQAEVTQLTFGDQMKKRVIRHAIVRVVVFVEKRSCCVNAEKEGNVCEQCKTDYENAQRLVENAGESALP